MGRIIPYIMENSKNVPNHQPAMLKNQRVIVDSLGIFHRRAAHPSRAGGRRSGADDDICHRHAGQQ